MHTNWSRPAQEHGPDPSADLRAWRLRRLLDAGFPLALAETVEADTRFDLHELLQLVDRGCPPELAVRILAPLPRASASGWVRQ